MVRIGEFLESGCQSGPRTIVENVFIVQVLPFSPLFVFIVLFRGHSNLFSEPLNLPRDRLFQLLNRAERFDFLPFVKDLIARRFVFRIMVSLDISMC